MFFTVAKNVPIFERDYLIDLAARLRKRKVSLRTGFLKKLREEGTRVRYNRDGSLLRDGTVWKINTGGGGTGHCAVMPPGLAKRCILAGCRVGATILDPFAGSGTTGEAAIELGRKAILIELNPTYVDLIRQRCDITPGLALAV